MARREGLKRIVAVGDSITWGCDSSDPDTKSWPARLMSMLHDTNKYEVVNLGLSGRTMMKDGDMPYWNEKEYQTALNSNADVVILMLGTNDSKNFQWNQTKYYSDYLEMGRSFLNMTSKPDLYIMVPPPLYLDNSYSMNQTTINERFPDLIPQIGKDLGLPDDHVIDIFNPLGGKELSEWQFFCDGQSCDDCHPNDAGYSMLASEIYKKLFLRPIPQDDASTDQEDILVY